MYTSLKVTTDYTLLKSLIKIKDLIDFCVSKNILSCGICDTNLFGSIEFYKLAKKNNIKPIIGLEINYNNDKIYLYAKNYEGYKNLLIINTIICERNVTLEELKKYKNNVLCIIPFNSIKYYEEFKFYVDLYLSYENKEELKQCLIKTNNVVYLNDIKVFNKEDEKYLNYLDKIKEINENIKYENHYFKYSDLDNFDLNKIKEVVDLLNLEIPFNGRYIPKYKENNSYEFLYDLWYTNMYAG